MFALTMIFGKFKWWVEVLSWPRNEEKYTWEILATVKVLIAMKKKKNTDGK